MKNTNICNKCKSKKITITNALPIQMGKGFSKHLIKPMLYICLDCGYIESWVVDHIDLKNLT